MTETEREARTVHAIYASIRNTPPRNGSHLAQLESDLYQALERWHQALEREKAAPVKRERPFYLSNGW